MAVLAEIGAFLVTQALGTLGTDIFLGFMPGTPDACIALYETGGLAPERGFGVSGVQYEHPGVQLVFRGPKASPSVSDTYTPPRIKAETAYRALTAILPDTVLSGIKYLQVTPQQAPFLLDRDENQRVRIAFNVLCFKEPS